MVNSVFSDLHRELSTPQDRRYLNLDARDNILRITAPPLATWQSMLLRITDYIYRIRPFHTPLPAIFQVIERRVKETLTNKPCTSVAEFEEREQGINQLKKDLKPYYDRYLERTDLIWKRVLSYFIPSFAAYLDRLRSADYIQLNGTLDQALQDIPAKKVEMAQRENEQRLRLEEEERLKEAADRDAAVQRERERLGELQKQYEAKLDAAVQEANKITATLASQIVPCPHPDECLTLELTADKKAIANADKLKAHDGFILIDLATASVNLVPTFLKTLDAKLFKGVVLDIKNLPKLTAQNIVDLEKLALSVPVIHIRSSQSSFEIELPDGYNHVPVNLFNLVLKRIKCSVPIGVWSYDLSIFLKTSSDNFFNAFPKLASHREKRVISFQACPFETVLKLLPRYDNTGYMRFELHIDDATLHAFTRLDCIKTIRTIDLCNNYKFSTERYRGQDRDQKAVHSVKTLKALNDLPHVDHILVPGKTSYSAEALGEIAATCPKVVWYDDLEQSMRTLCHSFRNISNYGYETPKAPHRVKKCIIETANQVAILKPLLSQGVFENILLDSDLRADEIKFMFEESSKYLETLQKGEKISSLGTAANPARYASLFLEDREIKEEPFEMEKARNRLKFGSHERPVYKIQVEDLDKVVTLFEQKKAPLAPVGALTLDMQGKPVTREVFDKLKIIFDLKQPDKPVRPMVSLFNVPVIFIKNASELSSLDIRIREHERLEFV